MCSRVVSGVLGRLAGRSGVGDKFVMEGECQLQSSLPSSPIHTYIHCSFNHTRRAREG